MEPASVFSLGPVFQSAFPPRMSDQPLGPEQPEPPRREFKFKATEFERANRAPGEKDSTPAIDVKGFFQGSQTVRPPAVRKPTPPPTPAPSVAPAANDVHAMLKANLAHANEAGENEVAVDLKRTSRRKRDYWILLICINLFFLVAMALSPNVATVAFGGAGIVLCTLGLTWIMWFVMDDY